MNPGEKKVKVGIVVAITSKNAAIGNGGKLLVYISDDLKRFKAITTGHAIILGRKTYESIGRLLPGRPNFIVTRNIGFQVPGAIICTSIEDAIAKASKAELASPTEKKEIFLIGGGEIYRQGLPFTDKLYLTLVESDAEGDVFFPDYSEFKNVTFKEDRVDEKTGLKYSWIDLER
ncbi:MAG: dihydrofolate reductase [Patescibacteria group bacterium]